MERWRDFFRSAEVDLWTICERAMTLAYMDDPDDFPSQRDRLAQKLFAPEKLDLEAPECDAPREIRSDQPTPYSEKIVQSRGIEALRDSEANNDQEYRLDTPNGNHDEAEALTEEMEEEQLFKVDVYRIKDLLLDSYQSEREIFNSLQRLELMQLSFCVLKETEIGKTVNNLRKHSSGRVQSLARQLVSEWKDIAEHWYKSVEDVTGAASAGMLAPDSMADGEEDGLPSPPMDEGALLAARTASIEMSQLFDFMDDETSAGSGNPNSPADNPQPVLSKSTDCMDDAYDLQPSKKHTGHQTSSGRKKNDLDARKAKDRSSVSSSNGRGKREGDDRIPNRNDKRRMSNVNVEKKSQKETIEKRFDSGSNRRLQTSKLSSNAPVPDPPQLDQKILASKRKLQENYQQAENAKRQRTIQVMELQDLPKGGPKRLKASQMVNKKLFSHPQVQAIGRR